MPKIGIIHSGSRLNHDLRPLINTFVLSLEQEGFVDGKDGFSIDGPHFGEDNPGTLSGHAANLVAANVDVLVAAGGTRSSQIAMEATTKSPQIAVVFTTVTVPVRPAANMTGICAQTAEFDRKRLGLLQELMPAQNKFGALINSDRFKPGTPNTQKNDLDGAAAALGLQQLSYKDVGDGNGGNPGLIPQAFIAWPKESPSITAALVAADPFFNNHRRQLVNAANNNGVAAIYQWREFVDAGGLMSFGPKLSEGYKLAAIYTASILRKEKQPKDLPIRSLTNFELVINLTTAKALKIAVPESLLTRASDIVV
jgi:putative tryptophan/tyrosine transport system substrate-binding protein